MLVLKVLILFFFETSWNKQKKKSCCVFEAYKCFFSFKVLHVFVIYTGLSE